MPCCLETHVFQAAFGGTAGSINQYLVTPQDLLVYVSITINLLLRFTRLQPKFRSIEVVDKTQVLAGQQNVKLLMKKVHGLAIPKSFISYSLKLT